MDLTLATGASSNHFLSMKQLLNSIKNFEASTTVIVYDLGLTESEVLEVKEMGYQVRKFDFSKYPAYFNIKINAG